MLRTQAVERDGPEPQGLPFRYDPKAAVVRSESVAWLRPFGPAGTWNTTARGAARPRAGSQVPFPT